MKKQYLAPMSAQMKINLAIAIMSGDGPAPAPAPGGNPGITPACAPGRKLYI